ncbi:MAG: cell division protein ZapA [Clostridia bacterium]|jgi:cell division protein ZapA
MEKVKTNVKIGGKEYTLVGRESEEYIHRVAIYVDRKMSEIEKRNNSLSTSMIAVLTAVNIADDYLKLEDQYNRLKEQNASLKAENASLKETTKRRSVSNLLEVNRKNSNQRKTMGTDL